MKFHNGKYFFTCEGIIKDKSSQTRWYTPAPGNHATLFCKDYYEVFIGRKDFINFYRKRNTFSNGEGGFNTYDIETLSCIHEPSEQYNAITFTRKVDPSVNLSFVRRQPGDVKKVSIAAYSFNDDCEPVLVNNFDPQGRPHPNNFSIYNNYEKPYYEKYFGLKANAPHFHFNTQNQDENYKRPNAISVENIVKYLDDLNTQTQDTFLQTETMGMPFLRIKNGDMQYRSVLKDLANKYCRQHKDDDITDFFFRMIDILKDVENNCNAFIHDYLTMQVDINALNEFSNEYPEYKDIISDFGYHILSSLNQCPVVDRETPNNDRER